MADLVQWGQESIRNCNVHSTTASEHHIQIHESSFLCQHKQPAWTHVASAAPISCLHSIQHGGDIQRRQPLAERLQQGAGGGVVPLLQVLH